MGDDASTVEQLRAELQELRRSHAVEAAAPGEELRRCDRELTHALEQQAATAGILRVIAASTADQELSACGEAHGLASDPLSASRPTGNRRLEAFALAIAGGVAQSQGE